MPFVVYSFPILTNDNNAVPSGNVIKDVYNIAYVYFEPHSWCPAQRSQERPYHFEWACHSRLILARQIFPDTTAPAMQCGTNTSNEHVNKM